METRIVGRLCGRSWPRRCRLRRGLRWGSAFTAPMRVADFVERFTALTSSRRITVSSSSTSSRPSPHLTAEWTVPGTHDRKLARTLAATNKPFTIRGLLRIAQLHAPARLVRNRDYWDMAGFLYVKIGSAPWRLTTAPRSRVDRLRRLRSPTAPTRRRGGGGIVTSVHRGDQAAAPHVRLHVRRGRLRRLRRRARARHAGPEGRRRPGDRGRSRCADWSSAA